MYILNAIRHLSRRLCVWFITGVAALGLGITAHANGESTTTLNWAQPKAMAVQRVSDTNPAQHEPHYLGNLDCSLTSYRTPTNSTMQTGCFTPVAFGLMDYNSNLVIFTGTDEAVPLRPYMNGTGLVPWPEALQLIAAPSAATGGNYLTIYKNPTRGLQDERDQFGQLIAKRMTEGPDLVLTDAEHKPIVVKLQTVAFSDSGSWLVAATVDNTFIRINLATLETIRFGQTYYGHDSSAPLESEVAITHNGRYVAVHNHYAETFKVYDLQSCVGTNCVSHEYYSFITSRTGPILSLQHLRFADDGLLSFEVTASSASRDGVYLLAPEGSIDFLTSYIGMGDSYTSGEGAFDYRSGTDTTANKCHLSQHSYPLLLTRDLFSASSGHSVACSGAKIHDIGSTAASYRGQVAGVATMSNLETSNAGLLQSVLTNYMPGYVPQQRFSKQYRPEVVTVGIGGNDVGFGAMIQECAMSHVSLHLSDNTCFNTYEDRVEVMQLIDRTVPRWATLYKQLAASSPNGRVYAIGYPQVASDTGACGRNVLLNTSELEFAIETITYLNQAIAKAAAAAHVQYVDVSQAFVGHRLCEGSSLAMNGMTAGDDDGIFGINLIGHESYHPNWLGQQLLEQAILAKTHNLTDWFAGATLPTPPVVPKSKLLEKPKSGRAVTTRLPSTKVTKPKVQRGKTATVKVASGSGAKAKSTYKVKLGGSNGKQIGTITSDDEGTIDDTVTIPADTEPGCTTFDVVGPTLTDSLLNITQPICIPHDGDDSDGDGAPDTRDDCPDIPDSGFDTDRDGVDDACDGAIGDPPADDIPSGGNGDVSNGVPSIPSTPNEPLATPTSQPSPTSSTIVGTFGVGQSTNTSPDAAVSSASPLTAGPKASDKTASPRLTNTGAQPLSNTQPVANHQTSSAHKLVLPDLARVPWLLWSLLISFGLISSRAVWRLVQNGLS